MLRMTFNNINLYNSVFLLTQNIALLFFSQRHNGPQERACGEKRLASIARPFLKMPFGKYYWEGGLLCYHTVGR